MPKSIVDRRPFIQKIDQRSPLANVVDQFFWAEPKGLNLTSRLSRVDIKFARDINNVMLDDGSLRSRYGTVMFDAVDQDIMAIVGFVPPSGVGYLVRATQTKLQFWTGTAWNDVPLAVFTGGPDDYFSFTNFGTQLLVANGVNKLFYWDIETGLSGFIAESVPSKHVATFNGRVVLSNTVEGSSKPYQIRWSVKNNSFDWTTDGSGFEDLFSAPGGIVDTVHGVFPITDDTALIVREASVWLMSITGNVLAPHRFTRAYAEIGTKARRSATAIPGGVMMVTRENVVALTQSDIRVVGDLVRLDLIESVTDFDAVVAKYDFVRNEYRVAIGSVVWRYNLRDGGWTRDTYPFVIRDMTRMDVDRFALPIDSLVGDIDGLVGTIDDLVAPGSIDGFLFVGA